MLLLCGPVTLWGCKLLPVIGDVVARCCSVPSFISVRCGKCDPPFGNLISVEEHDFDIFIVVIMLNLIALTSCCHNNIFVVIIQQQQKHTNTATQRLWSVYIVRSECRMILRQRTLPDHHNELIRGLQVLLSWPRVSLTILWLCDIDYLSFAFAVSERLYLPLPKSNSNSIDLKNAHTPRERERLWWTCRI